MTDNWQPPADIKPWIVCAAIKRNGTIICGARHWDMIMRLQVINYPKSKGSEWEQGFIDQFGFFHNRKEAMKIVKESGQPFNAERNGGSAEELYSEGLY